MWQSNRNGCVGTGLVLFLAGCNSDVADLPTASSSTLPPASVFSAWGGTIALEQLPGTSSDLNTTALEGCPFISPDGLTLFLASNRPGGQGGIDIWVAKRTTKDAGWGQPVNAGAPVNSSANDFCPTIAPDGHTFFFVSNRAGGCGGDDIYTTRRRDDGSFEDATHLGCQVNSAGNEAGPFLLVLPGADPVLYFSSTRAGGYTPEGPDAVTGDADIYSSVVQAGAFMTARLEPGVNSESSDLQPNLRHDGREIYFASNRSGDAGTLGTLGGMDLFTATRLNPRTAWSTPLNLGADVNTVNGDETRPSISWDALNLYFGSNRPGGEGMSDLFLTTRQRLSGTGT